MIYSYTLYTSICVNSSIKVKMKIAYIYGNDIFIKLKTK